MYSLSDRYMPGAFLLITFLLLICLIPAASVSAKWAEIPLEKRVKQADLVVVGKITKVENVMDGNAELAVGTITVSEVIKGDKDMKKVKLAWRTGRVLDPNTGMWFEVRTSVDIRYSKGQEGIWVMTRDPKNKDRFKARYPGYPIKSDEEKLKEVRGYATEKYEHKEIPAKPVNGLLAEVKVLNSPLYPGDDLAVDFRLTNVRKKGEIQIVDFEMLGLTLRPIVTGPKGEKIPWPAARVMMEPPEYPTAVLQAGAFYGRKITLSSSNLRQPGRYSLAIRYSNNMALKEKGFECWTGELPSNTVVFEVAKVDAMAVHDIKMLVKMKPTYAEGEPVTAEVRLYNSGDKEKEICRPPSELLIALSSGQVKDEKGNVLKWLNANVKALPPEMVKLAPGQATSREYDLRKECELPPGKYTFQLKSNIPNLGEMTSNEVSFQIIKKETPEKENADEQ